MVQKAYGTQQAMAEAFGLSQPTIWRWLNQSKQMPAEFVLKAEAATGVSRHHLRPDIYPIDLPPAGHWCGLDSDESRVIKENSAVPMRDGARANRSPGQAPHHAEAA